MPAPYTRPVLGAIPYRDGATFRFWAPHAPWVRVAGTFNGWSATAPHLSPEPDGTWSADVDGAAVGDEYCFILGSTQRWRVDPRALDVTQSNGNGVVARSANAWRVNDFWMPPWKELVIYEMHVSSYPDDSVATGEMLNAVARDLKHLQDHGVNAIQILSAKEFPGDDSWGYNPVHVFAVESAYGGPDALKYLVDAAHAHGLPVLLDVVCNHFGPTGPGRRPPESADVPSRPRRRVGWR
jgi:1,4-alpha-glucan branching enzyme